MQKLTCKISQNIAKLIEIVYTFAKLAKCTYLLGTLEKFTFP